MTEKSEALRLAEYLDLPHVGQHKSAAELRRLSAVEAQRDSLLEACRAMLTFIERHAPRGLQPEPGSPVAMARAAIKSVEGENHAKNF